VPAALRRFSTRLGLRDLPSQPRRLRRLPSCPRDSWAALAEDALDTACGLYLSDPTRLDLTTRRTYDRDQLADCAPTHPSRGKWRYEMAAGECGGAKT